MLTRRAVAVLVACAGLPASGFAQSGSFTWSGGMGRWLDASRWNEQGGPPNGPTASAVIGGLLGADATIDGLVTVRSVEIQSGILTPARLTVLGGATFQPEFVTNDGRLSVNAGSATQSILRFRGDNPALGGFGITELNAGTDPLTARITNDGVNLATELRIRSGHTVQGKGHIDMRLANEGAIDANKMWEQLTIANYAVKNSGVLRASNSGRLLLSFVTLTQTAGVQGPGRVVANGGEMRIDAGTVTGGIIEGINGGKIVASRTMFDGVDLNLNSNSALEIVDTGQVTLRGVPRAGGTVNVINGTLSIENATFENTGMIRLKPGSTSQLAALRVPTTVMLQGVGSLDLDAPSNSLLSSARIFGSTPQSLLVNESRIAGSGQITLPYVNRGLITADRRGRLLELFPNASGSRNDWRIRVQSGGLLSITNQLTQGPEGSIACEEGTLNLANLTLTGGSLSADGTLGTVICSNTALRNVQVDLGGQTVLLNSGNLLLDGVLGINAGVIVTPGRNLTVRAAPAFTHDRTFAVEAGPSTSASLTIETGVFVAGAGLIELRSAPGTYLATLRGGATLGEGITLAGRGSVDGALTVMGLLSPGVDGGTGTSVGEIQLAANASIRCASTSRTRLQIQSAAPGQHDRIVPPPPGPWSGTFFCDGRLELEFLPGSAGLARGEAIELIRGSSVQGRFAEVVISGSSLIYQLEYTANSLRLIGLGTECYPNCDASTVPPVLNATDFACFLNSYRRDAALPEPQQIAAYGNCDGSTAAPVLNALDFACFLQRFRNGCL